MKIIIDGSPEELAALVLELQERQGYETVVRLEGGEITEAVLRAIRDRR